MRGPFQLGRDGRPCTGAFVAVSFVVALAAGCLATSATDAASLPSVAASPTPAPTPSPSPSPIPSAVSSDLSSGRTVLDLGSNFLERLGNQATFGGSRLQRSNPGGGGASGASEQPRFRSWAEAYGVTARSNAQGDFVGDKRVTWGGVAGIGMRLAPGVNVGLSIDQSRTRVDVPLALQSAALDLTQLGFNASVDHGPWTWAIAIVHGFGGINARRDTILGATTSVYGAHITGVLSELDYYWSFGESRVVPKLAFEYARATTAAFQETGGLDPLSVSGTSLERGRVLVGAEVGRYFVVDGRILDVSAYGKFVDNFTQNLGTVTVSLGVQSITLQGLGEGRYGADAGAALSLSLSSTARLYLNYDAKLRSALQSHQGTLGVELKW
ncbi:autotransporter outer membrane beta-barrel domain-containing protein [Bradyrhizobium sp. 83002]|uniref:autotransporter outer membrane beta-barrel domain-containing protein n=1 Tax=Bradyrhizobium aeschynomenes TaxID=2734909 RepID=UPI001553E8BD|nr:autotransporter outer membrane beta-barrel domain-containing protein [Bradyrhizobium aeschynomenes]NPU14821.1 autotransporter outer membrane beta-barrel domain-containing protein [Bradyrhizobium aeschynomenes]